MNRIITATAAMTGIVLVTYAIATPGSQFIFSFLGGVLFGTAWMLRE